MKVCLVYPNFSGYEAPHTGLMLISAILKEHGYEVFVADFSFGASMRSMQKNVLKSRPDIIGVTVTAGQMKQALEFIRTLKGKISAPVIFGGPHVTLAPDLVIKNSEVDAICIGEGEMAMLDFVNAVQNNEDYSKIPNLWVRKNLDIVKNPPRPLIADLDSLPLPDFNLFEMDKYLFVNEMVSLVTGRGCLFKCSYCINHKLRSMYSSQAENRYARKHSVDYTMRMVDYVVKEYNVKFIAFNDDLFTMDRKWLKEFTSRFSVTYPNLHYYCTNRIEFSDPELFKMLANSGCANVRMAIEAGDETIRRDVLNRNMSDEKIIEAFKSAKDAGLTTTSYNILGSPYETALTMQKTLAINQKVLPNQVGVSICMPFPGTDIYDRCVRENLIDPDFEVPLQYRAKIVIKHSEEVKRAITKLKRTFRYHVFKIVNKKKALAFLVFDTFHYYFYDTFLAFRRKLPFCIRRSMLAIYWRVFSL